MKTIIYFCVVAFVFAVPVWSMRAQTYTTTSFDNSTLTANNLKSLAPSLLVVFGQLSNVLAQKQNQFANQDMVINNISNTIGSLVGVMTDVSNQNLRSNDRTALALSGQALLLDFNFLGAQLSRIQNERNVFEQVVSGVGNIVTSMSQTIATI